MLVVTTGGWLGELSATHRERTNAGREYYNDAGEDARERNKASRAILDSERLRKRGCSVEFSAALGNHWSMLVFSLLGPLHTMLLSISMN